MRSFPDGLSALQPDDRADHFFQRNSAVLEGVIVVVVVVIIVIRIEEKLVFLCENIGRADIRPRQFDLSRVSERQHILFLILQIPAYFISKIACCFTVTDDARRGADSDGAVVCGNKQADVLFSHSLQGRPQRRMQKPGARQ